MNKPGRIAMIGLGGLSLLDLLYESPLQKQQRQAKESQQTMLQIMQTTNDPREFEQARQYYENAEWVLKAQHVLPSSY